MATARKPKIELYYHKNPDGTVALGAINWRLVGANGEIMCQCTQGFGSRTDAMRNINAVAEHFGAQPFIEGRSTFGTRVVGPKNEKPS